MTTMTADRIVTEIQTWYGEAEQPVAAEDIVDAAVEWAEHNGAVRQVELAAIEQSARRILGEAGRGSPAPDAALRAGCHARRPRRSSRVASRASAGCELEVTP